MTYPIITKNYKQQSLVLPKDLILQKKKLLPKLPSRAILCFSAQTAKLIKIRDDFCKSRSFYMGDLNIDVYQKTQNKKTVSVCVVSQFGMGAPAAVIALEKLRAMGVKHIISVGAVGCLDMSVLLGTKIWIQKSFRDEGCSYHYKKPSAYIKWAKVKTNLDWIKKMNLQSVTSWTTDAPFRETKSQVEYFTLKGAQCVEMESAALMAAGQYYGISVLCLGVVSDLISIKSWTPGFSYSVVKKSLNELINQVLFF